MPILLALLLHACTEPPPSEGTFLSLSYNVAGLPEGISGSHPERNTPIISPLLNGYDLVLVQEDFVYHEALAAGATHPYRSEPMTDPERFFSDGLNRFSVFPLGPLTRVRWDACHGTVENASDCLADKGFSVSEVTLAEDLSLLVYNHHAEAGGSEEDVAARADNFTQLGTHIVENAGDRAVLVTGDTNLHGFDVDDEPILSELFTTTDLADACRTIGCGDDRIDRFLFRSGSDLVLTPTEWAVAGEFVDEADRPLSDHVPIRARFSWARPE
ncbi:MAG: endonuclease [Deltaproteobacteria bacterium]|nr:endonuclease [Deltaproteobacteria bacterium]MBW2255656.1 endonuclease [Deltaproteobacteria bacterium]